MIPILVPLFVGAFRRADELAVAMECRCYNGGQGRTSLRELTFRKVDGAALAVGVLLVAAITVLKILHIGGVL